MFDACSERSGYEGAEESRKQKRSKYKKTSDEEKTEIGRYAYKHGVSAVIKYFDKKFGVLKQQTVFDYKRKYGEIAKETQSGGAEIKSKKRGRPSLLPEELMSKSIEIIKSLRLKRAPVSYAVMAAVAKGVVMSHDRTLLVEYGGIFMLLARMGTAGLGQSGQR